MKIYIQQLLALAFIQRYTNNEAYLTDLVGEYEESDQKITESGIRMLLGRMKKRGFISVSYEKNENDRRVAVYKLTEKGQRHYLDAMRLLSARG